MTAKIIVTEKICSICKELKPASEFYKQARRRDGLQTACKPCDKRLGQAHYQKHKDDLGRDLNKINHRLKRDFGITLDQWLTMYEAQGKVCAICGDPAGMRELHVDHCHETGKVRGLLCVRCNIGLGYFKDSPQRLKLAAAYMEEHLDEVGSND